MVIEAQLKETIIKNLLLFIALQIVLTSPSLVYASQKSRINGKSS